MLVGVAALAAVFTGDPADVFADVGEDVFAPVLPWDLLRSYCVMTVTGQHVCHLDVTTRCSSMRIARAQEIDHFGTQPVVVGMVQHLLTRTRTRQAHIQYAPDTRIGSIGHHHHAISKQQRFIDIVGYQHRGQMRAFPNVHQNGLQFPARQRIQHAKGFIKQQHLGSQRERTRDTNPLAHAIGKRCRAFVAHIAQANALEIVANDVGTLLGCRVGIHAIDT